MLIDSRILRSAILLALVVIVGVSGYVLIEGSLMVRHSSHSASHLREIDGN